MKGTDDAKAKVRHETEAGAFHDLASTPAGD
jgi:hypothetical protein